MSTPRRTEDRQHRRNASAPYSLSNRPSKQSTPAPETPSRLSGILSSIFSPFRSARKPTPQPEPESGGEGALTDEEEAEDQQKGEENEEQYAVYGRSLETAPLDWRAPPSPTPATRSSLYPSLSLASSELTPSVPFPLLSTPRFPGNFAFPAAPSISNLSNHNRAASWGGSATGGNEGSSPPSRATEELVKFFKEKEDQGNAPLTPIEQAGVFHLLQQAGASSSLPTAFTPDFKMGSSASPTTNSHQGHISSSSLNSLFDSPSGSVSQSSPFRRRRPIYVGAGYSSQGSRRRKQGAQSTGDQGLTRSKSDGMVYEMANGSSGASGGSGLADGKRRRVDEEAPSNVPLESGFGLRGSTSTPSFSSSPEPSSEPKRMSTLTKATSSLLSYAKPVTTTPARPSPLWQVSKAATPSPSPPKKSAAPANPPTPTRAADLMLDIIRQEDASNPKVAREAILNPYASTDSPIARIPRSRPARATTPRRTNGRPAPEISQLEMLEQTMPPEYRKEDAKRARTTAPSVTANSTDPTPTQNDVSSSVEPSPPAPTPAPRKQTAKGGPATLKKGAKSSLAPPKKVVEVIELSSSDDDDNEEEDESEEKIKPSALKRLAPSNKKESSKLPQMLEPVPTRSTGSTTPVTTDSAPPKTHQANIRPAKKPSSLVAPTASQLPGHKAFLPPTSIPPPPPILSSATTFTTPTFTFTPPVVASVPLSDDEARRQALVALRASLPTFSFEPLSFPSSVEDDVVLKALQDVVKGMSRSELPTIVL